MPNWESYLNDHCGRFIDELLHFLRIPSISTLPENAADVRHAATWVSDRLRAAGVENVEILETGGMPSVYGDWCHAQDKPTLLLYGHFDTQPVDPLELWTDPPFDPHIRDERIYARGASDDKGNMLLPILAVEALLAATGTLPVNVKFLLEGEEESGSPNLPAFVSRHAERLRCDWAVCADGTQRGEKEPAVLRGFKGLCALQIDVRGPGMDLHSGIYGGTVQNPLHALSRILASTHTADGRVLVDGFYDDVIPLAGTERELIAAVPCDDAAYRELLGVREVFGEPGYGTLERAWARPTLEINGMWGGFSGDGVKTVLPSQAHAKISCRLVPDQDPEKIAALVATHLESQRSPGVEISVTTGESPAWPYLMPVDHPGNRAAHIVLEKLYGRAPYYTRLGGTLPVCGILLDVLDIYTVTFSFGLEDENAHAPDEFFRLSSFARGQRAYCMLLEQTGAEASA
jgi:acetylornithine deacetylase/succinyl-diaminopimelate desuccinylase-like protein